MKFSKISMTHSEPADRKAHKCVRTSLPMPLKTPLLAKNKVKFCFWHLKLCIFDHSFNTLKKTFYLYLIKFTNSISSNIYLFKRKVQPHKQNPQDSLSKHLQFHTCFHLKWLLCIVACTFMGNTNHSNFLQLHSCTQSIWNTNHHP